LFVGKSSLPLAANTLGSVVDHGGMGMAAQRFAAVWRRFTDTPLQLTGWLDIARLRERRTPLVMVLSCCALAAIMVISSITSSSAVDGRRASQTPAPEHSEARVSHTALRPLVEPAGDQAADERKTLHLSGTLFLDPSRLARVHSRFRGEMVTLGTSSATVVPDKTEPQATAGERTLQPGDRVRQGQLLALICSEEVGEEKNELQTALAKLDFSRTEYERLKSLAPGVVAQRTVLDAWRQFEADSVTVEGSKRTLRSWRVPEQEIATVCQAAERVAAGVPTDLPAGQETWARVGLLAPLDGTILECSARTGDLVDTKRELFRIADLSTLGVRVDVAEQDLPLIAMLAEDDRTWHIHLDSPADGNTTIVGQFQLVGVAAASRQHAATIVGWLPNADGGLRVGQSIVAEIDLPTHSAKHFNSASRAAHVERAGGEPTARPATHQ
jgi:hypothetical protein